jgi:hypothetical protein
MTSNPNIRDYRREVGAWWWDRSWLEAGVMPGGIKVGEVFSVF